MILLSFTEDNLSYFYLIFTVLFGWGSAFQSFIEALSQLFFLAVYKTTEIDT